VKVQSLAGGFDTNDFPSNAREVARSIETMMTKIGGEIPEFDPAPFQADAKRIGDVSKAFAAVAEYVHDPAFAEELARRAPAKAHESDAHKKAAAADSIQEGILALQRALSEAAGLAIVGEGRSQGRYSVRDFSERIEELKGALEALGSDLAPKGMRALTMGEIDAFADSLYQMVLGRAD
jgi:hypothetical protein